MTLPSKFRALYAKQAQPLPSLDSLSFYSLSYGSMRKTWLCNKLHLSHQFVTEVMQDKYECLIYILVGVLCRARPPDFDLAWNEKDSARNFTLVFGTSLWAQKKRNLNSKIFGSLFFLFASILFLETRSTYGGGATKALAGSLFMDNVEIANNTANAGSGIEIAGATGYYTVIGVSNSVVSGNTASLQGAGFNLGSTNSTTFVNVTFIDNIGKLLCPEFQTLGTKLGPIADLFLYEFQYYWNCVNDSQFSCETSNVAFAQDVVKSLSLGMRWPMKRFERAF